MAEGVERKALRFLGHKVGSAELALIQEVVGTCGGLSRMELAATVCELLGVEAPHGVAESAGVPGVSGEATEPGGLVLPAKRPGRPAGKATEVPVTARGEPGARLVGTARDLGEIRLQRVQRLEQRRLFREPGGALTTIWATGCRSGAHLRYLVYASEAGGHGGACRAVFERGLADCGARPLDWMGGRDAGAPSWCTWSRTVAI